MSKKCLAMYLGAMGLTICAVLCNTSRADIVERNDQSQIKGKVISLNDAEIVFQADGAARPQHIPRSEISRVIFSDDQGGVPPGKSAAAQGSPQPSPQRDPAAPAGGAFNIQPLTPPESPYVTDAEIGQAITRGAKYLAGEFVNSTLVEAGGIGADKDRLPGADALAVYALLQCGLAVDDSQYRKDSEFMKKLINVMKTLECVNRNTYARGIRATALALLDRPEDRGVLNADVKSLLDSSTNGGYIYGNPHAPAAQLFPNMPANMRTRMMARLENLYDNSNSQYGLLGVWSGAEVGAEVPQNYWEAVQKHWTDCQCADGQWAYQGNVAGTYSMTLAGLASMFVCHDYIDVAKFGAEVGRDPFSPPLLKGLDWMEAGDNSVPDAGDGYSVYGLERVGLASGFKYFGTHDWYREVATQLVRSQQADGSWHDNFLLGTDVDTSYMLLFLARGRHPILMNKLRFEHYWSNRPRDVANLAAYAGKELESVFNWQVVTLQHDWHDWTDSPILYIASHVAPQLTDDDYAKIRAFVDSGGMLFTQADGGSADFNDYVEKVLLRKVFPDYEMGKIPPGSPIYSVYEPMKSTPSLQGVSNGARLLWVHSPEDIGQWWQQRASKSHLDAFQLGMNIFVYAAGKRDFQNRIATNYIPEPPASSTGDAVKIARVKYPLPTWNPEPYAWTRFGRYFQWKTSVNVQPQVVDMEKLGDVSPADVPLAHLTGTLPFTPSDVQIQSLKKYVDNGGILFIDACGGGGFNDSIKGMLEKIVPKVPARVVSAGSPLLGNALEGMTDLSAMPIRQYAKSVNEKAAGFASFSSGKGQIIYSSMDITNGLLGSQTWGISGYTSSYCLDFMKNLVLWSAQGAPATSAIAARRSASPGSVSSGNSFPGSVPSDSSFPGSVSPDRTTPSSVISPNVRSPGIAPRPVPPQSAPPANQPPTNAGPPAGVNPPANVNPLGAMARPDNAAPASAPPENVNPLGATAAPDTGPPARTPPVNVNLPSVTASPDNSIPASVSPPVAPTAIPSGYHSAAFLHLTGLPGDAVTTAVLGGIGGNEYKSVSPNAQPVVGFRYKLTGSPGKQVIHRLEPVFYVDPTAADGTWTSVVARHGYVVAGVLDDTDKTKTVAIRIIFARYEDGHVNMTDTYQSDWIGSSDLNATQQLAGHGEKVIGIFGQHDVTLKSLGLIVIPPDTKAAATPADVPALHSPVPATVVPDSVSPANAQAPNAPAPSAPAASVPPPANPAVEPQPAPVQSADSSAGAAAGQRVAPSFDLFAHMTQPVTRDGKGYVLLERGRSLRTKESFKPPIRFKIVMDAEGNDTRIGYAADQIIFNWEMVRTELRVDGGPANGRHKPGAGELTPNKFCEVDLIVEPGSMTLIVDGVNRYHQEADFSAVNEPFSLVAHGREVKVKSIEVSRP